MIKKENLDFFLTQLFGQPPLEPEEFSTLSSVLERSQERLFLVNPSSSIKPYLLGAALPGIMFSFYVEEELAKQATEALLNMGIAVHLVPQEFTDEEFERVLGGLTDGSIKILIGPASLVTEPGLAPRIVEHIASTGANLVLAHDILLKSTDETACAEFVGHFRAAFNPEETGASLAYIVTGTGTGQEEAFPVFSEGHLTLGSVSLTDEERDELLKPLPKPLPPLPAQAYEPEIDEEENLPTQIRMVSSEEQSSFDSVAQQLTIPPPVDDSSIPVESSSIDEGSYLTSLEGALEQTTSDSLEIDFDQDQNTPVGEEFSLDLEELLKSGQQGAQPETPPRSMAHTRKVVTPSPGDSLAEPVALESDLLVPEAQSVSLDASDLSGNTWDTNVEEIVSLEDLGRGALDSFEDAAPEPKATPELFVTRKVVPPAPLTPQPPISPAALVPVDPLGDFLVEQKEKEKEAREYGELDDLLGIGKGPDEATVPDEATLASLQELLGSSAESSVPTPTPEMVTPVVASDAAEDTIIPDDLEGVPLFDRMDDGKENTPSSPESESVLDATLEDLFGGLSDLDSKDTVSMEAAASSHEPEAAPEAIEDFEIDNLELDEGLPDVPLIQSPPVVHSPGSASVEDELDSALKDVASYQDTLVVSSLESSPQPQVQQEDFLPDSLLEEIDEISRLDTTAGSSIPEVVETPFSDEKTPALGLDVLEAHLSLDEPSATAPDSDSSPELPCDSYALGEDLMAELEAIALAEEAPVAPLSEDLPTSVEAPMEAPMETPVETPVETAAEIPAQAPAESLAESLDEVVEIAVEDIPVPSDSLLQGNEDSLTTELFTELEDISQVDELDVSPAVAASSVSVQEPSSMESSFNLIDDFAVDASPEEQGADSAPVATSIVSAEETLELAEGLIAELDEITLGESAPVVLPSAQAIEVDESSSTEVASESEGQESSFDLDLGLEALIEDESPQAALPEQEPSSDESNLDLGFDAEDLVAELNEITRPQVTPPVPQPSRDRPSEDLSLAEVGPEPIQERSLDLDLDALIEETESKASAPAEPLFQEEPTFDLGLESDQTPELDQTIEVPSLAPDSVQPSTVEVRPEPMDIGEDESEAAEGLELVIAVVPSTEPTAPGVPAVITVSDLETPTVDHGALAPHQEETPRPEEPSTPPPMPVSVEPVVCPPEPAMPQPVSGSTDRPSLVAEPALVPSSRAPCETAPIAASVPAPMRVPIPAIIPIPVNKPSDKSSLPREGLVPVESPVPPALPGLSVSLLSSLTQWSTLVETTPIPPVAPRRRPRTTPKQPRPVVEVGFWQSESSQIIDGLSRLADWMPKEAHSLKSRPTPRGSKAETRGSSSVTIPDTKREGAGPTSFPTSSSQDSFRGPYSFDRTACEADELTSTVKGSRPVDDLLAMVLAPAQPSASPISEDQVLSNLEGAFQADQGKAVLQSLEDVLEEPPSHRPANQPDSSVETNRVSGEPEPLPEQRSGSLAEQRKRTTVPKDGGIEEFADLVMELSLDEIETVSGQVGPCSGERPVHPPIRTDVCPREKSTPVKAAGIPEKDDRTEEKSSFVLADSLDELGLQLDARLRDSVGKRLSLDSKELEHRPELEDRLEETTIVLPETKSADLFEERHSHLAGQKEPAESPVPEELSLPLEGENLPIMAQLGAELEKELDRVLIPKNTHEDDKSHGADQDLDLLDGQTKGSRKQTPETSLFLTADSLGLKSTLMPEGEPETGSEETDRDEIGPVADSTGRFLSPSTAREIGGELGPIPSSKEATRDWLNPEDRTPKSVKRVPDSAPVVELSLSEIELEPHKPEREIDGQVADVLKGILSEYPDDLILRSAPSIQLPVQERFGAPRAEVAPSRTPEEEESPSSAWPTTVVEPLFESPDESPQARQVELPSVKPSPESIEQRPEWAEPPTREREAVERENLADEPAGRQNVSRPSPSISTREDVVDQDSDRESPFTEQDRPPRTSPSPMGDIDLTATASLPPTVGRILAAEPEVSLPAPAPAPAAQKEIRQVFDLPTEGHVYFYELPLKYGERQKYLRRIWEDPDSNVDGFLALLPRIEKAFPDDPRVLFALGYLQFLADRRVQGLTTLNRCLELLTEAKNDDGIAMVLSLLHEAFPDDVGIAERLVDHLEEDKDSKGAAHVLWELGERALGKDNARRALGYLERAFNLDAENRSAALSLVHCFKAIGDEAKSLDVANRWLGRTADDALFLLYKAQALARLGRGKAADLCMDKAIKQAGNDPTLLETFRDELTAARDDRYAHRVIDLLDKARPGSREPGVVRQPSPIESRPTPPCHPETGAPATRPVFAFSPVVSENRHGVPLREPPVSEPPPSTVDESRGGESELWENLTKRSPRVASEIKALKDLEEDLKTRKSREPLSDQQITDLLRRYQLLGDKLKVVAPDEAGRVYRCGMNYLGWIKEPLLATVWRDDFERRLRKGAAVRSI